MNPHSYLSGTELITLNKAVVRYWLIIPLLMTILFSAFLVNSKDRYVKIFLTFFLLSLSVIFLFSVNGQTNLGSYQTTFQELKENRNIMTNILHEDDYLITSTNDKTYYGLVKIISWWGGPNEQESNQFFNSADISYLTRFFLDHNKNVYFLSDRTNFRYIPILEDRGLNFELVPEFQGLYNK